ncbi:protein kinase [Gemmatimonadota bacterium]
MTQDRPRRLAAVWFADIVGYTDLSARDEDLALRVVRELQRIAKKHCQARGGRVVKLMGDAVLTVFDSVDGAVRAAIALRDEFLGSDEAKAAEVSLRIGVHVGEVADAPDGDVYGDAVNVASRIERVAEPGQVVISDVSYRLSKQRSTMEVEDLGEFDLKGVPDPVGLFAVELVGETETASVRELLQEAIAPLQLLDVEGMGGMGEIYLARDPGLRRTLAVKVLKSELAADSQARARFQREATVIAGLSHPNVITIHSVGELKDETPYFVMDYIEGGSLADRLEQEGPLSVPEARRILGEVASALQAAHAKGIVHRDIKAANVLWDLESGRALVTDWGIAALDPTVDLAPETRLTKTGVFIGSPQYMSPEQMAGDDVGPETDIYSLGLLAFELLTGHGPFPAETPRELMISHLREDAPKISNVRQDVDPEVEAVVAQCLSKSPSDRPDSRQVARIFAPAADQQLEWPPPGLDSLLGIADRLAVPLGLGSLFLLAALAEHLLSATNESLYGGLPGTQLRTVLALFTGLLTLGYGVFLLARGTLNTRRALGLGFGWGTILEVASDNRGDSGALIIGRREYSSLTAGERTRLRKERVRAAVASVFLAVIPIPLLVIFLAVGPSMDLTGSTILTWSIGPSFLMAIVLVVQRIRVNRQVRAARRSFSRRRRPSTSQVDLVEPWYEVFNESRGGSGPGRGPQGGAWVSWVVAGILTLQAMGGGAIVLAFALTANAGSQTTYITSPRYSPTSQRAQAVDGLRWLRLPPDSSLAPDPLTAVLGRIYERDEGQQWSCPPPDPSTVAGSSILGVSGGYPLKTEGLVSRAFRGLTDDETEYLRRFSCDPFFPGFESLARARSLDTQVGLAIEDGGLEFDIPLPRYRNLRIVGDHKLGSVAYAAAQGDLAGAETSLREVLSVGFLLIDNGTSLLEIIHGVILVEKAADALDQVYLGFQEPERLGKLRNSYRILPEGDPEDGQAPVGRPTMAQDVALEGEIEILRDSTALRGLRWDLFSHAQIALNCRNLRSLLLGPPAEFQRMVEELRTELVRFPGEEKLFRAKADEIRLVGQLPVDALFESSGFPATFLDMVLARAGWITGVVTRNPRIYPCALFATTTDLF